MHALTLARLDGDRRRAPARFAFLFLSSPPATVASLLAVSRRLAAAEIAIERLQEAVAAIEREGGRTAVLKSMLNRQRAGARALRANRTRIQMLLTARAGHAPTVAMRPVA